MKIKDIAKLLENDQTVSIVTVRDICANYGAQCCSKGICEDCDECDCQGCQNKKGCNGCNSYENEQWVDSVYDGKASQIPLRVADSVIVGIKLGFWKQEYVGRYKKKVYVDRNRITIRVKEE